MNKKIHLLILTAALTAPMAFADCLPGVDGADCSGGLLLTRAIQAPAPACPAGTHEWVNARGDAICESLDAIQPARVGGESCPTGSKETVDAWGNRHCKLL